jgi:hypothetical protein
MMKSLTDRQVEHLAALDECRLAGLREPNIRAPLGMTALHFSGAGQAFAGLIKRGLVEERNRIFYITNAGQKALADHENILCDECGREIHRHEAACIHCGKTQAWAASEGADHG